jgi:hypothetical protein
MTTPATPILLNLAANIGANTLTALQQSCLQQALNNIAATFPGPDDTANGLTDTDEPLAREWIAALYAITLGVSAVSGSLARAFSTNAAPVLPGAAIAIGTSATLTPGVTGRLKVRISGVIENNDSSAAAHPFTLSINTGLTAGTTGTQLFTQDVMRPVGAANPNPGTDCFSLVVDLDKLAVPFIAPPGTPIQINANVLGSASASLNIAAGGLQLEVEEASA